MTLGEYAVLVGAPPKWVLNARAMLGHEVGYSAEVAEQLALAYVLNRNLRIPLPHAWALAEDALKRGENVFRLVTSDELVTLTIDVQRLRSAVATRRSQLATTHQPRRAGRKPRRAPDAIAAARRYGLDVTLLQANLERSPTQRLRQLDAMAAFPSRVRRKD